MASSGWVTTHSQARDGAVESEQRVSVSTPVVPFDADGARELGNRYWREVERSTRRLVRAGRGNGGVELRLLGRRPVLLAFDRPFVEADAERVRCVFPIRGGILTQRGAGAISFEQIDGDGGLTLRSTIRGFYPALAAREGRRHWTGALYNSLQSRIHVAISRRYFRHLIEGGRR
jgi:hypothetical protein